MGAVDDNIHSEREVQQVNWNTIYCLPTIWDS